MLDRPGSIDYVLDVVARAFPAAGLKAYLIGGMAVNLHGYARNTLDVDFMVKLSDQAGVRRVMEEHGYINRTLFDNVVFYHHPAGGLRVDFLSVDSATFSKLGEGAELRDVGGHLLWVPCVLDIVAMKIFALSGEAQGRHAKDLPDIAYLCRIHGMDLPTQIKPLCEKYGVPALVEKIADYIDKSL
jgi:hypothetical protein